MAIIEDLEESASGHPGYWIGGVIAVLALVYIYFSSGSKAVAPISFSYNVGPSDAQIAAGTAQQNQLQADQTAVSIANINAGVSTATANDYFGYLTQNSANAVTENQSNNNTVYNQAVLNNQASQYNDISQQVINNQNVNGAIAINANNNAAAETINSQNDSTLQVDTNTAYNSANLAQVYAAQINANNNATYLQAGNNAGALATANAQAAANAAATAAANNQISSLQSQLNASQSSNNSSASTISKLQSAIQSIVGALFSGQGYQGSYNAAAAAAAQAQAQGITI